MKRNQTLQPAPDTHGSLFRLGGLLGLALGALILAALALDLLVMPLLTHHGREERCPRVLGLGWAEAQRALREAGFEPVLEARRADSGGRWAAGQVMDQYPLPGRLTKCGRRVHLTISAGGRMMRVPDLRGVTQRQATGLLADARLEQDTLRRHWRYDERFGQGAVVGQTPAAGDSLPPGGLVSLTLSLGPPPDWVNAPSLLGLSLARAEEQLERSGLATGYVDLSVDSLAGRLVLEQDPPPGTPLVPGSAIDLRFRERSLE